MRDIDREIEVVEHIIEQLNRCLFISVKNARYIEIKNILLDLHKCKKEIKKLYKEKVTEYEAAK